MSKKFKIEAKGFIGKYWNVREGRANIENNKDILWGKPADWLIAGGFFRFGRVEDKYYKQ